MPDRSPSPRSSAEKRILWELGRRYKVSAVSDTRPVVTPPARRSLSEGGRTTARDSRPVRRPLRRRGLLIRRLFLVLVAVCVLGGGIFGYKILAASNRISVADRSLLGQLKDLLFSSGDNLKGEEAGRVNVLLIAVGGEGHKGENLADTIIVASIQPNIGGKSDVALLSIPRDLYVQVPGEEYFTKINAVHAYGESRETDGGPEVLRTKVEDITGLPLHYFVRVDFIAFKHIVDAVGGVTITNERAFFDYWHKIDFQAGTEKMNGERSLAYVRARYIEGPEGGDFKRAERQQKVLLALREKVFSIQTAFDFAGANTILNALSDNIRTDMHLWEMKRFFEISRTINGGKVHSAVLSTGPGGVLEGGTEVLGGAPASVLRPRTGDYSEIHTIAANIFNTPGDSPASPAEAFGEGREMKEEPESTPEATPLPKPTLEIRNGTNVTGLAAKMKEKLAGEGYNVVAIGNAKNRGTEKTTVYALETKYADAVTTLAESLEAQADSGLPTDEPATQASVLIILGPDAAE